MPNLSNASLARLQTCDPRIQMVLKEAIKYVDFVVLCGERSQAEQEQAYAAGKSTKRWPESKHNRRPEDVDGVRAVDIAPYPIDWNNVERFRFVSAFILGLAAGMGVKMRAGVDWNMNFDPKDEKFIDGPHLELV